LKNLAAHSHLSMRNLSIGNVVDNATP
jgi:hypothetical protein